MFLQGNQLSPQQRVEKGIVAIMGHPTWNALAGVMMMGGSSVTTDPSVPTAQTNGRDVEYGQKFVDALNDAELRYIQLHENFHKMYRHLHTWKHLWDEWPDGANMATDYVINIKLDDADDNEGFIKMPTGKHKGLVDARFRGMDTQQVFNILKQETPPEERKPQAGGTGIGSGFDEHDWEGAKEMTPQEVADLEREIDVAIRQGALMAGKTGAGGERLVGDLLEPQINWQDALREFITETMEGDDDSTWAAPDRRFIGEGIYMPSGVSETMESLSIAIDTSGSTYAPGVLDTFMSEAAAITKMCHPFKLHVIYWDTKVCRAEVYEYDEIDDMIGKTQPEGGGGTDVTCVTDYYKAHNIKPEATIILTDGHLFGGWGQWDHPTLWCVIDNRSATADVGKTLHITTNQLQ